VTAPERSSTPDLVGLREITLRLGVDVRRASTVTRRRGLPEPCTRIRLGRIWHRADVEDRLRSAREAGQPVSEPFSR
jgi:hypothetical protein